MKGTEFVLERDQLEHVARRRLLRNANSVVSAERLHRLKVDPQRKRALCAS